MTAAPGAAGAVADTYGERPAPPFGRRLCEVAENAESGGYRLFTLLDSAGPAPRAGQFYMLAAEEGWGRETGRPYLPRAFSVAAAAEADGGVRLGFLADPVGPGTRLLCDLEPGQRVWVNGPLGRPFSAPRDVRPEAAGAILVGGGIGVAPLALLRQELAERNVPVRTLLGFRDQRHSGGLDDLFACCEVRLATDDGHRGHRGFVTDLLGVLLEGDAARSAVVYSCGPPPMLEAVREMCEGRGVACQLALEAPMACGFGACFGCAVPLAEGGYMRLCVDGPVVDGSRIETALIPGSGH